VHFCTGQFLENSKEEETRRGLGHLVPDMSLQLNKKLSGTEIVHYSIFSKRLLLVHYGGHGAAPGHDWTELMVPEVLIIPVLTESTLQGLRLKVPSIGLLKR